MKTNVLVELTNRAVDKTFTYNVPSTLEEKMKVGIRVQVPFGKQTLEGFVMEIEEGTGEDLKEIYDVVDEDVILNKELLELGKTMKKMTLCTLISAYQAMLPKALKAQNKTTISKSMTSCLLLNVSPVELENYKLTETQKEIIALVKSSSHTKKKEANDISASSVKTLLKKGILKEELVESYTLEEKELVQEEKKVLNQEQRRVTEEVLKDDKENTYLLYGVTGSGKTEVYMEIIEHMLQKGKNSIVLVPEISLTPQMVNRFQKRFLSNVAILHSRLNETEKYDEYRKIARNEVKIVIGTRSAIFAPLQNIGVIVIDEEHTNSYKQEHNPKYSAIDIAIERAKYHHAKVILGSATPSLESFARVIAKKYQLLELTKRANAQPMPKVSIIDLKSEARVGSYLSKTLTDAIFLRLQRHEQVILLLNRRGYASFITCSSCGYVSKCPNCDITLTYHKSSDMERCHYCGYAIKREEICPSCHEKAIQNLGMGTERIEEELNRIFGARVVRMDFDTTSTKGAHERIIEKFRNQEYDILLGTQMIAKGLDFPNVTLVGVINADTSLMIPNFRSSEYTFQLLSQVAGRSGRGEKTGEVMIQTYNKDHYAIELASKHQYIEFFKEEMKIRKELNYPPYCYMVLVRIMGKDYDLVRRESAIVSSRLKENLPNSTVLGPSMGTGFKIKNIYRFSIIIKYKKEENLYPYLEKLLTHYENNHKIQIDVDFNPISC